ncbi:MAG: endonuclease domain-containing protein [Burkholderiales bacterium]|nr:endonuclease domain-containing protein [Burkholderiales bacterium]
MHTRDFAKVLRQNMTDAEMLLWRHLRARRLAGQKFRRQQPLGPYIVDFIHFGARLIVEADGSQHQGSASDELRDAWLKQQGFTMLRFWNDDILLHTDAVLEAIWQALDVGSSCPLRLSTPRINT